MLRHDASTCRHRLEMRVTRPWPVLQCLEGASQREASPLDVKASWTVFLDWSNFVGHVEELRDHMQSVQRGWKRSCTISNWTLFAKGSGWRGLTETRASAKLDPGNFFYSWCNHRSPWAAHRQRGWPLLVVCLRLGTNTDSHRTSGSGARDLFLHGCVAEPGDSL